MLLTIDIGNTTVAVGGFLGPELRFVRRLPSDRNMDAAACAARMRTLLAEEGAAPQDVEGAVLSSVVPSLTQVAVQAGRPSPAALSGCWGGISTPGLPTGDYDVSNLGMDRLVDCVAALARWRPPLAVFGHRHHPVGGGSGGHIPGRHDSPGLPVGGRPQCPGCPTPCITFLPSPRDCWVPILCPACAAAPSGAAAALEGSPSAWRRSWAPSP